MQQGLHAIDTTPGRLRTPQAGTWMVVTLVIVAACVATGGVVAVARSGGPPASAAIRGREPASVSSVLAGSPAAVSASTARLLLSSAPAAVIADAN
ncbi:MAG: hypothetical protein WAK71_17530, partial [Streptosporangiaceae bacterium]